MRAVKFTGERLWWSGLLGAASLGTGDVLLLGFLAAVAVRRDVDHFRPVSEAVDESDDAGGVGEHLTPFGKRLVRGEHDGFASFVAARDDLEEQVGVAAVVGEIADLIDAEQRRHGVAPQAPSKRGRAILSGEVGEHVPRLDGKPIGFTWIERH